MSELPECLESFDGTLEICCHGKSAFSKAGIGDLGMISL